MSMKISYEVLFKEGTIIIESVDESFDSISIEIDQFWSWVKREGLNEYCEDYYDPNEFDGHGQSSGHLSLEEYFNLHHSLIENDLIKYLTTKKTKPKI
jgi:hypothetical protein